MKRNPEIAQSIRRTAYFFWEQDGKPEGRSMDYWLRAKEMHLRELAYDKWLAEGTPAGRALVHWVDAARDADEGNT